MNDMQFSDAEEARIDAEAQDFLDHLSVEEQADFEAFMVEEAEQDAHNEAMRATLDDGMEGLGFATAEEVDEIAKKYGVGI